MKTMSTILVLSLVTLAIVFCGAQSASSRLAEAPIIDIAKPDTWEARVKRANEDIAQIARSLISVAKDKKRPVEERRKAILLLGSVRNKESIEFLIANVSLRLPMRRILGDRDAMLETPCTFVLHQGGWNTAKAVLDSLAKPRPNADLLRIYGVFKRNLTRKRAIAIVDVELEKLVGSENIYKKNLKTIKTYLK